MKKSYALLFIFGINFLSAQIPNSGFELWDNQPVPLQWETNSHPLTLPPWNPYIVVKDTDYYAGNYSANLIGNNMFHSWAKTTFAVSQHPASLTLYYKILFAPCVNDNGFPDQDTVSVLVEVLHNSAVVDSGYWSFTGGSNMLWSQLTIPVSYNSTQFDSCRITIVGGKVFGGCGFAPAATEFKVDALQMNYFSACANTGVIVQGVECRLIDTLGTSLLMPCNVDLQTLGFNVGDTINFSFISNACISFCMQGTGIDITCIDTGNTQPPCSVSVTLQKQHPTSYVAINGWMHALVNNATPPVSYLWSNNVSGADSITNLGDGVYCVTVTDSLGCTATACDTLTGAYVCIDSALICNPVGLCCDAPLVDHVCGCDSVTYINGCIATLWHGVTGYYHGDCVITNLPAVSATEKGIFISPVPARDKLNLTYSIEQSSITEIRIVNLLGEVLQTFEKNIESSGIHKTEIILSNFTSGIYFVEVKNEFERKLKLFVKE